jgi:hypothetical protein
MPNDLLGRNLRNNPYRRAVIVFAGLAALSGVLALASSALLWGRPPSSFFRLPLAISLALLAVSVLVMSAAWLLGWRQARQAREFLTSDRPFIRWTYSTAEWRELRGIVWQEEKDDWKAQFGCLAALIGLAGLLTGGMVGFEQGFGELVAYGLVGAAVGGLAGGLIAAVVAGGNHLAARSDFTQAEPSQVALAPGEIFANGEYFKANGRTTRLLDARLQPGQPALLQITVQVVPWRADIPSEQNWQIPIPDRLKSQVESSLTELFS